MQLKNTFNDYFFFITYHLLVIASSVILLFIIKHPTQNITFANVLAEVRLNQASAAMTDSAEVQAFVSKLIGTVLIYSQDNPNARQVTQGEEIQEGMTIETGNKSSVLIGFTGPNSWQFRLSSNSRIKIDELKIRTNTKDKEHFLFDLLKGGAIFLFERKSEADFEVKTNFTSYGVRGTKFAVLADDNLSILTVQHGKVEAYNLKSFLKDTIKANEIYTSDKDGKTSIREDAQKLSQINWDLNDLSIDLPGTDSFIDLKSQTSSESESIVSNGVITSLNKVIEQFQAQNEIYSVELNSLKAKIIAEQNLINSERLKVAEDISCLENSSPCKLHMEKVLIHRGFPRTFGPPHVRRSLIEDLKLYLTEKESVLESYALQKTNLEELLQKRISLLHEVEQKKSENGDPEELLKLLSESE